MDLKQFNKEFFLGISLFLGGIILASVFLSNIYVEATGGGKEVAGLITPMIDRTIEAIENNNTELAIEELNTIKDELKDTFELDEED